jgi:hypothetical protein
MMRNALMHELPAPSPSRVAALSTNSRFYLTGGDTLMRKIALLFISLMLMGAPVLTRPQPARPQEEPEWTTARVEKKMPPRVNAVVLRKVRASRQAGYDRVVFEFDGDGVPDYWVEYKRPPFYQGETERTVKVAGRAFISVTFRPAVGHDIDTGQRLIEEPGDPVRLTVLRDLQNIEDHGGDVTYVLGLTARKPFRAQLLSNPARVALDIKY